MQTDVKVIGGKLAVDCPNQDCDPEDGCCICEHTGWVDAGSEIFKQQRKEPKRKNYELPKLQSRS
jgi:hypothetical protein